MKGHGIALLMMGSRFWLNFFGLVEFFLRHWYITVLPHIIFIVPSLWQHSFTPMLIGLAISVTGTIVALALRLTIFPFKD